MDEESKTPNVHAIATLRRNFVYIEQVRRQVHYQRRVLPPICPAFVPPPELVKSPEANNKDCTYCTTQRELPLTVRQSFECPLHRTKSLSTISSREMTLSAGDKILTEMEKQLHQTPLSQLPIDTVPVFAKRQGAEHSEIDIDIPGCGDGTANVDAGWEQYPSCSSQGTFRHDGMLVLPKCREDCVYCKIYGKHKPFEYPNGSVDEALRLGESTEENDFATNGRIVDDEPIRKFSDVLMSQ